MKFNHYITASDWVKTVFAKEDEEEEDFQIDEDLRCYLVEEDGDADEAEESYFLEEFMAPDKEELRKARNRDRREKICAMKPLLQKTDPRYKGPKNKNIVHKSKDQQLRYAVGGSNRNITKINFENLAIRSVKMRYEKVIPKIPSKAKAAAELDETGSSSSSSNVTVPATPAPMRSYYSSARIGSKLFFFGGSDGVTSYDDLYSFDTATNEWKFNYTLAGTSNNQYNQRTHSTCLRVASGHKMIASGRDLILFCVLNDGSSRCLKMVTIMGVGEAPATNSKQRACFSWSTDSTKTAIPALQYFSLNYMKGLIYLFGGSKTTGKSNDLYIINLGHKDTNPYYYSSSNNSRRCYTFGEVRPVLCNSNPKWPAPRSHHAAATVGDKLFIFGGNDGTNDLNDLWMFNGHTWHEIDILGAVPPPLSSASTFAVGERYIYIHGGVSNRRSQRFFYRLDTKEKRWNIVEPSNKEVFTPRAGHEVQQVGNALYFYGGYGADNKTTNDIVMLNHYTDEGMSNMASLDHYDFLLNEGILSDITFVCYKRSFGTGSGNQHDFFIESQKPANTEEPLLIKAHCAILAARCPYFASILAERRSSLSAALPPPPGFDPNDFYYYEEATMGEGQQQQQQQQHGEGGGGGGEDEDVITLEVVDFEATTFLAFLRFLYTGRLRLDSVHQVDEMIKIGMYYQNESVIKLCSSRSSRYLAESSCAYMVWNDIERDYRSLINNPTWHDVVLRTDNGGTILANKAILARAPYFKNMFLSGMRESVEREVTIENISSLDALQCIVEFIYVDRIHIPLEVCVEVYAAAQLFGLDALVQHCKDIMMSQLEAGIVFDLFDIAQLYDDVALARYIKSYVKRNVKEVSATINSTTTTTTTAEHQLGRGRSSPAAQQQQQQQQQPSSSHILLQQAIRENQIAMSVKPKRATKAQQRQQQRRTKR